jgi:hypothetical protein
MADHVWFHDHLAAYCADGLDAGERQRFEDHAAACGSCRLALEEMRGFDGSLDKLFAGVRPAPGWESRVIGRLRTAPARRSLRVATWVRWVGGAAAVVMFGLLGAALHTVMQNTGGTPRLFATGPSPRLSPPSPVQASNRLRQLAVPLHDGETMWKDDPAASEFDADISYHVQGRTGHGVPGKVNLNDIMNGDNIRFGRGFGGEGAGFGGGGFAGFGGGIGGFSGGASGQLQRFDNGISVNGTALASSPDRLKAIEDRFSEENVVVGRDVANRTPEQADMWMMPAAPKAPSAVFEDRKLGAPQGEAASADTPAAPGRSSEGGAVRGFIDTDGSATATFPPPLLGSGAEALGKASEKTKSLGYYGLPLSSGPAKTPPTASAPVNAPVKEGTKQPEAKDSDEVKNLNTIADPEELLALMLAQPKKDDPPAAQRKIIRTGEIEFEIESFDAAVASINKLIGAIPGAFIATVNSEKLPNGKMRGSAVVRMPPEKLDGFVLDLRRDLTTSGDLKSQRIGSQDVTKQYTDIESRLRAARTMEERLLTIIKSGKGEIKDLIAAERELGNWRTKIEEMEGEIRYYNNQIGLSTLTITMYEKEIRAAAELVVSQQVTMRIEAEDVESALQSALSAVTEAKGRVTKSDLKQQAAGQYEATLLFQVAPAAANAVRDKLKKLGIVTHHDTQRQQESVGGTSAAAEVKSRQNDVQFSVTLYNIANIQPRESYHLKIAVADVTPDYRKLQEAVLRADGQVRAAQLSEQDLLNVSATLDFDVPTSQREAIDKQLAQLGDVLSRSTQRVAPSETATERKVGYRLTLHSITSIPARESHTLQTVTFDVVDGYRTLREAVEQAKGHVRGGQLNEQDKLNITANLDFDVPTEKREAIEKLLDEIGDVYSRNTARLAPGDIASDRKVGYKVTLRNAASMPPREKVTMKLEAADVERVATTLKDMVKSAKGRVHDERVKYEENGQVVVLLAFDVPLAAKEELVRKFKGVATLRFARPVQNPQVPDTELALANLDVMITTPVPIVSDEGLWPQVRTGLVYSFRLLSFSVMFIILGVSFVLPWALVIWGVVRLVRRLRTKGQPAA